MPRDTSSWLAYVTDAASVVFVATCALILASAVGEARIPGLAASMLSSQLLLGIAVVAGLVTLAGAHRPPSSPAARMGYALAGLIVAATVATLAWDYFAPFEAARLPLTVVSTLTAASSFIMLRRSRPGE